MDRPWVGYYDPGVPPEIDYPPITLSTLLDRTVERWPHSAATMFHGATLTYGDLGRQVDAFAAGLQARGVSPGDRVAVMLPNVPQFIIAFYGALKAGAVVVPTNPLYTATELEHQLNDAGAMFLVTLDQLFGSVQPILGQSALRGVILTDVGEALPRHIRPLYAVKRRREGIRLVKAGNRLIRFAEIIHSGTAGIPVPSKSDDLAVLQYTGGTTGTSKGAMLTHRNLVANALQCVAWQKVQGDGNAVLCAIPFFHVYGLTVAMNLAIASGSTMILVPRFDPAEVAKAAERGHPQLFPGVPTMYIALSLMPNFSAKQFGSLNACISGAAPLPLEVQDRFEEVCGARLVEGYGLTEASPVTHSNPIEGHNRHGTIGLPFPDTDARIVDPESWDELPAGKVGELVVSGPQIMHGYWNHPEETAAVLHDGWLRTGDLGTVDQDGFFSIVDRKKDVIIASGFNIYPREVEDVLFEHPKVKEAAVVGAYDFYRGETVKAFIVLRPGDQATPEEIIAFCREKLASFKVPKIVEFRSELPKSLIGKVLRRELRDKPAPDRTA